MPKADRQTMDRFQALLPKDPSIVVRPMFGHRAAFIHGHMFSGTFGADFIVRLDEEGRRDLLAIDGTRPFEPMKGRPMKEYVMLPRAWVDDRAKAGKWIARAFAWTSGLPPKAAKARGKS